jgi:hypothetical protein
MLSRDNLPRGDFQVLSSVLLIAEICFLPAKTKSIQQLSLTQSVLFRSEESVLCWVSFLQIPYSYSSLRGCLGQRRPTVNLAGFPNILWPRLSLFGSTEKSQVSWDKGAAPPVSPATSCSSLWSSSVFLLLGGKPK